PPRWRAYSAANGDGQITGQYADATDSRIRWPGRKRGAVARSGTRTRWTTPGSRAAGAACESRWVRFRIPAVTWADVPSRATSLSRTTAIATGAVDSQASSAAANP